MSSFFESLEKWLTDPRIANSLKQGKKRTKAFCNMRSILPFWIKCLSKMSFWNNFSVYIPDTVNTELCDAPTQSIVNMSILETASAFCTGIQCREACLAGLPIPDYVILTEVFLVNWQSYHILSPPLSKFYGTHWKENTTKLNKTSL